jgi:hypothetical protein
MSNPTHLRRSLRAGILLAAGLACGAVPVAAEAAAINLGTAKPFVVLGGSAVTNTGPSVLNGALGVSPSAALTGFGLPAVVNGATHVRNGVAANAQSDLTTAYNVAAAEPAGSLTGRDLGNVGPLVPGAYSFSSSAQLTGALVLDGKGDPNAQFVFKIGSTLTTASGSSVRLVNGASPCNVFWQVGSSATLGTATAFAGNVMALTSITMTTGATLQGRALARNGAVTLDSNVINASMCGTSTTAPPGSTPGSAPGSGSDPTTGTTNPPGSRTTLPTRKGTAQLRRTPLSPGTPSRPGRPGNRCTDGFTATVRGRQIKRVVFRLDGKRIASRTDAPFKVVVRAAPGRHIVSARVTFKDATAAKTMKTRYRACGAAALQPRPGPSRFTG